MAKTSKKHRTYEARVWRLAFLLTGTTEHATSVVMSVAQSQKNLTALDPTHLDRIVILAARDYEKAPSRSSIDKFAALVAKAWKTVAVLPPADGQSEGNPENQELARPIIDPDAAALLARVVEMDSQPREAWVLARIDEVGDMWMARAMDCSKTAGTVHLAAADRHMDELFDDADPDPDDDGASRRAAALAALRSHVDNLDPISIIDAPAENRRKTLLKLAIATGILALIIGAFLLTQI